MEEKCTCTGMVSIDPPFTEAEQEYVLNDIFCNMQWADGRALLCFNRRGDLKFRAYTTDTYVLCSNLNRMARFADIVGKKVSIRDNGFIECEVEGDANYRDIAYSEVIGEGHDEHFYLLDDMVQYVRNEISDDALREELARREVLNKIQKARHVYDIKGEYGLPLTPAETDIPLSVDFDDNEDIVFYLKKRFGYVAVSFKRMCSG